MSKKYLKKRDKKAEKTEREVREAYHLLAAEGADLEKKFRAFVSEAVGFKVGRPKSVVPLLSFRCNKCRGETIFHITYKKVIAITCPKCSNSEVFDPLEPVD